MKGKPDLVKASRIADAAKKVGGVYVFATRNQQLPQEENASSEIAKYPLAEYSCKECATSFHSNAGLEPHCFACGSQHVTCKNSTTASVGKGPKIHADADLNHMSCKGCGTLNILPSAYVTAAADSIHCVTCGHENVFATALANLDGVGNDTMDDLELVDTSEDGLDAVDADADADGDMLEDLSDETPVEEPAMNADDMPPASPQPSVTLSPVVDPPLETTEMPGSDPAVDGSPSVEYSEEDEMDINLLDMGEDTPVEELSLVWVRDNLALANSKFQLVATLSPEDAADKADIMQSQEFAQAVGMMIKSDGLIKTCAHFGFKPVVVTMPVKKIVNAHVEKALEVKAKTLDEKIASVAADFGQAVNIAAAGIVKNFWQNIQDPLRANMIQTLTAASVKKPEKMVDRVCSSSLHKLMQLIIEKASEISKKSAEARNELAETLDAVNYRPTKITAAENTEDDNEDEDEDEDDDEDGEDTVESRLSTAAVPVLVQPKTLTAGAKTVGGSSAIRAILASRPGHFNS